MNCSQLKLCGYHGTCSKFRESIENNGLDPQKVKFRNDHWLGQGVYFFAEFNQALWWANDIANKAYNAGSFALIYKSDIEVDCDKVLNLDDNSQKDRFFSYILKNISEIEKDANGRYPVFTRDTFRAVYFDYYKIKNNISVIMYTFSKDSVRYASIRKREELRKQKELAQALGIYYGERQICVSEKCCIKTSVLVYNEEEEVI